MNYYGDHQKYELDNLTARKYDIILSLFGLCHLDSVIFVSDV